MQSTDQKDPVFQMEGLLKEESIDTKKLHESAAELTKQKIIDAAAQRFAIDGYQKTSIDGVAKEAGVTKGAIYHHFKDKKELLMAANRSRQLRTQKLLRKAIGKEEDFFEGLRKGLGGQFKILRNDPIIRGVTREYMAMAMSDPDVNQMYRRDDIELLEILQSELVKSYPDLSSDRRELVVQEIYISLAGLFIASVVDSPVVAPPEKLLCSIIERVRAAVEQ